MFWVDTGLPCVIEKRAPIIPIKHMSSSHSLHLLKKQLYDTKFTIKETHIDIECIDYEMYSSISTNKVYAFGGDILHHFTPYSSLLAHSSK